VDISKELLVVLAFGVGLYIERNYAPYRVASNSKTWAQRAQEMALYGTVALAVSFVISRAFYEYIIVKAGCFVALFEMFKGYFPYKYSGTIAFMFVTIAFFVQLLNLRYRTPSSLMALYHELGNSFERSLFHSFINSNPVMLTYKNGWVYIVLIPEIPEVGKKELYLNTVVLMSGYKDESAMTKITEAKFIEFEERLNNHDLLMSVLTTEDLVSVSPFEFSYNKSSKTEAEKRAAS
jgi:hypothetical protein